MSLSSSTTNSNSKNKKGNHKSDKVYDLTPYDAPRLQGFLLKSTVFLCESHYLKNSFLSTLYVKNKVPVITQFNTDNMPTFYPIVEKQPEGDFKFKKYFAEDIFLDQNLIDICQSSSQNESSSSSSSSNINIPENNSIFIYNKLYKSNKASPNDILNNFIEVKNHSDEQSPPLAAFIKVLESDIKEQANQSSERWKNKEPLSILDGVPISIKDELDQIGYHTTCGTTFLSKCYPNVKEEDSFVAKKLRERGAILVGKNNMHEIGISTLGYNTHFGFTRNPYNINHYPGGSSSGSAASVSSGLNPISIGCDGGGSIRVPASLCGVVGIKPTFARVSHGGVFELCYSVGHIGPIGSCVVDTAVGYACIAGADPKDPQSVTAEQLGGKPTLPIFTEIPMEQPLKGLKIGIFKDWINDCIEDIKEQTYKCIDILREQGAEIVEIEIPNLLVSRISQLVLILSEMKTSMKRFKNHNNEFQLDSRISLAIAGMFTAEDYIQSNRIRTYCIEELKKIFTNVDAIVTPTNGVVAPEIEKGVPQLGEVNIRAVGDLMKFVFLGNISGIPGISIPIGVTKQNNLPIGFQIMGKWWEEDLLFYISFVLERNIKFNGKPQYFNSPLKVSIENNNSNSNNNNNESTNENNKENNTNIPTNNNEENKSDK
ncbi:hypothetical protein DICPUDRAFT_158444 [Dictyostelium purpureum]|uniref:Amidase domain-containing protein n=1 Tax=Dictyostelium purpureum TaxID=5786 RepID=F1A1M8_DICPU|nr:uncharacterized protein DICPUDRAFT_158444 [Dictyostelium purpureum]EGC29911.1 hypothetical protein DICPUDRAFT_158444 [Dictyostelium purpureum]|eukprot:XP_003293572.1 hypothetical protein DICPUDRAFT_158444 [Dictyostelium purpureum]